MDKRQYITPAVAVAEISPCGLICRSGYGEQTECIDISNSSSSSSGGQEPAQDDDGWTWAD